MERHLRRTRWARQWPRTSPGLDSIRWESRRSPGTAAPSSSPCTSTSRSGQRGRGQTDEAWACWMRDGGFLRIDIRRPSPRPRSRGAAEEGDVAGEHRDRRSLTERKRSDIDGVLELIIPTSCFTRPTTTPRPVYRGHEGWREVAGFWNNSSTIAASNRKAHRRSRIRRRHRTRDGDRHSSGPGSRTVGVALAFSRRSGHRVPSVPR